MLTSSDFAAQRERIGIEQAEAIVESHGGCPGMWDCSECLLAEYMYDPSECTEEGALEAAHELLSNTGQGICIPIW